MTDRKPVLDAEQRDVSGADLAEEEACTCLTEGPSRTWKTPTWMVWSIFYIQRHAPVTTAMRFMSHNKLGLWQLGVTHVLNAAHGKLYCQGSEDLYGTMVKCYGVPDNDLPTFDLSLFFYPAAEFINQALTSGGKVFVHCAVGVGPSATLVLAFLMIHHQHGLLSSLRFVQQKRWIFPNRGFLRQLKVLDRKLQEKGLDE